ncbi:hypothetical protein Pa4123_86600 [Phytohabitans aurantiacus]|uniref:Uncharacterized protein n=1 Tax=Phytohabitans aurantiacus TaxID=3016789 RepID=A0ABQ5RB46_9ACTN|nr:hypothetical protein Pa4123_86600 [Phytohabitans aurantiacus]
MLAARTMYGDPCGPHTVSTVMRSGATVGPDVCTTRMYGTGFTGDDGGVGVIGSAAAGATPTRNSGTYGSNCTVRQATRIPAIHATNLARTATSPTSTATAVQGARTVRDQAHPPTSLKRPIAEEANMI